MRFWIRLILGLTVTAVCILAAARVVDWSAVGRAFSTLEVGHVVLSSGVILTAQWLWAMRWHGLIGQDVLPLAGVFRFTMIGCLANALLPARAGGVIRLVLLKKRGGVRISRGLATIVLERLFDVGTLSLMALAVSLSVDLPARITFAIATIGGATLAALAMLFVVGGNLSWLSRLSRKHSGGESSLAGKACGRIKEFALALEVLRSPGKTLRCLVLTAAGWCVFTLGLYVLSLGFRLSSPPVAIVLVTVMTNVGAMIPSAPASLGVYHFMAVVALAVWSVDFNLALAFAVCAHALLFTIHLSCGLLATWVESLTLSGLVESSKFESKSLAG